MKLASVWIFILLAGSSYGAPAKVSKKEVGGGACQNAYEFLWKFVGRCKVSLYLNGALPEKDKSMLCSAVQLCIKECGKSAQKMCLDEFPEKLGGKEILQHCKKLDEKRKKATAWE